MIVRSKFGMDFETPHEAYIDFIVEMENAGIKWRPYHQGNANMDEVPAVLTGIYQDLSKVRSATKAALIVEKFGEGHIAYPYKIFKPK